MKLDILVGGPPERSLIGDEQRGDSVNSLSLNSPTWPEMVDFKPYD